MIAAPTHAWRSGRPRVVGTWDGYGRQQLARVREDARAARRARWMSLPLPWRWVTRFAILGLVAVGLGQPWWALPAAAVVGLLVGFASSRRTVAHRSRPSVLEVWREWQRTRKVLTRSLLVGLDDRWVVLPDRVAPGWPVPVTVAVGPSGSWALWLVEPVTLSFDPANLRSWMAELAGAEPAHAWTLPGSPSELDGGAVVARLRSAPSLFGPREVAVLADRIEFLTHPEPMEDVP